MSTEGPSSVAALIDAALAATPEAPALIGARGRLTFAQLEAEINQATRALTRLGVGPGDRVAASLRNDTPIVVAFLATQRLGAIWVGIPRPLAGPEKAYLLGDSGAAVLLLESDLFEQLDDEIDGLPSLRHRISVDREPPDGWSTLTERELTTRPELPTIDRHAPAGISYTSGTTGFPKGAVHSQHNLLVPVIVGHRIGKPATTARQGAMLPLTSLNVMVLGPINAYFGGDTLVCVDRSDAPGITDWIEEEEIGSICMPPTIYFDLLNDPSIDPRRLSSLVEPVSGGSQVSPELVAAYSARFGRRIMSGYGMTEAPTSISWADTDDTGRRAGGVGRPLPQVEIEIVDATGEPVGPGEVGEITVAPRHSGPFAGLYTPMLGYWNRPDETAQVLHNGRYHTGDLGYIADDGEIVIKGRRNDLIIRGSGNVYPAEIERVLADHPAVGDAVAFGVPDERLGECVAAAVVLTAAVSVEDLLAHCAIHLAPYKVPERVLLLEELPRNATGKVLKNELISLSANQP